MITLYGIKNCDTVKKARRWLEDQGIEHQFHDVRTDGLEPATVKSWVKELGWEVVVNKRSTTWKELDEKTREDMNASVAVTTLLVHPTLLKRPLLDTGHERHTGFSPSTYHSIFNQHTL